MEYCNGKSVYHVVAWTWDTEPGKSIGQRDIPLMACTSRRIGGRIYDEIYYPEHGNEEGAPDWFRTKRLCRICLRITST